MNDKIYITKLETGKYIIESFKDNKNISQLADHSLDVVAVIENLLFDPKEYKPKEKN